MFTQKELQDIDGRARDCKEAAANQNWKRVYDRLAEAAFNLERMEEASKDKS